MEERTARELSAEKGSHDTCRELDGGYYHHSGNTYRPHPTDIRPRSPHCTASAWPELQGRGGGGLQNLLAALGKGPQDNKDQDLLLYQFSFGL